MRHRINKSSLGNHYPSTNGNQVGHSNSYSGRLMNFNNSQQNQLHFTNSKISQAPNHSENYKIDRQTGQGSKSSQFSLNDTLNDLDFESDLQSRSFDDDGIVDDRILRKYKKILHHYNSEYGLSNSDDAISGLSAESSASAPLMGNQSSFSSAASSSGFSNHVKNLHNQINRVGVRKYSRKDSYYRHSHWIKLIVAVVIAFLIILSGMYYHHVHNQNQTDMATSYPKSRSIKNHHPASKTVPVHQSVSKYQRDRIVFLVNELYGRVNRLISRPNQVNVTQLKFSSVPLSRLFINGVNNRNFQPLTNRCIVLKNGHRIKIKSISPIIQSMRYQKHFIQVGLNSKVRFVDNKKRDRKLYARDVKNIQLKLVKRNGRYKIMGTNSILLV